MVRSGVHPIVGRRALLQGAVAALTLAACGGGSRPRVTERTVAPAPTTAIRTTAAPRGGGIPLPSGRGGAPAGSPTSAAAAPGTGTGSTAATAPAGTAPNATAPGATAPGDTAPSDRPSGRLVFRNSGLVGIQDLATGREIVVDPDPAPFVDPGVAVSRDGRISVATAGRQNREFHLDVYGLDGRRQRRVTFARAFSFQTSTVLFSPDGTRLAVSVDEPRSADDDERIARVLVFDTDGREVARLDGYEEPVWLGDTGDLVVRDPDSRRLTVVDGNLRPKAGLGVVTSTHTGAYDASRDGRILVYEPDGAAGTVAALDLGTGRRWVAARDRNSDLTGPTLSPDGRWLAFIARDLLVFDPHIVPFTPGATVDVDSERHSIESKLADCRGRIGWV